ncbi:hypothetical protein Q3G72_027030 [Acer saccharum]|nr:hypothetical protein Q3G72_027030 [Acer saccharum]
MKAFVSHALFWCPESRKNTCRALSPSQQSTAPAPMEWTAPPSVHNKEQERLLVDTRLKNEKGRILSEFCFSFLVG